MKHNFKKILILVFLLLIFLYIKYNDKISNELNGVNFNIFSEYKIVKEEKNKNYLGDGQKKEINNDNYYTTFTTTDKKVYKEYKQNGKSDWHNKKYWGGTMAKNGCGITSISIILSAYNKDYTPEDLRKKYYPVLPSDNISEELEDTFEIENSGFYFDSKHLSEECLTEHLQNDKPILICVWNKPNNNRWTTSSHYMVLLAADTKNKVYVSNPNGGKNDSKSSGWYNINEITPYLAKALYIYE